MIARNSLVALFLAFTLPIGLMATEIYWPPLPKSGYIKGRVATKFDVEMGDAAFTMDTVLGDGKSADVAEIGVIREPYDITIPQYAYYSDDDQKKIPVILIQAEKVIGASGTVYMIAGRTIGKETKELVGMPKNFKFLGVSVPK